MKNKTLKHASILFVLLFCAVVSRAQDVDYLIITGTAYSNEFQRLADHRAEYNGYSTKVITVDWIYANYDGTRPAGGTDNQTKIRNCIIDYAVNHNTSIVALGGDTDVIPARYYPAKLNNTGGTYSKVTDTYYSCLDGTWDNNSNGTYNEIYTDADQAPDIWIGRISIASAEQASNYIDKVIQYETVAQPDLYNKVLMGLHAMGTGTSSPDLLTGTGRPSDIIGDGYMEFLNANHPSVSDSEVWERRQFRDFIENGYCTGSSLDLIFDTLTSWDSTTGGDYAANEAHILAAMNNGYNYMSISAHGSASGLTWYYEGGRFATSDFDAITNNINFVYTISCDTAEFAGLSQAEALIRRPDAGSLAYMGCGPLSWYWIWPNTGLIFDYQQTWFNEVFKKKVGYAGEAFLNHKIAYAASGSDASMHSMQSGIHYIGDPALLLIAEEPNYVTVTVTNTLLAEAGSAVGTITLTRTDTSAAMTVPYELTGSAVYSADYTSSMGSSITAGVASFATNQATLTITVVPVNDSTSESDKTVHIKLAYGGTSYFLTGDREAEFTIVDDDNASVPEFNLTAVTDQAAEGGSSAQLKLVRSVNSSGSVTVNIGQTAGTAGSSDYNSGTVTAVTFADEELSKLIDVVPVNDSLVEGSETLELSITADAAYTIGTASSVQIDIADNEAPHTLTISALDATAAEENTDSATFRITRTGDTSLALNVSYMIDAGTTVSASDYNNGDFSGSATIGAGNSYVDLTLTPVDDGESELTEYLEVTLVTNSSYYVLGGSSTASVSIADNDPVPPVLGGESAERVSSTSASLSGVITVAPAADVWICWGATDGGTSSTGDWDNVQSVGSAIRDISFEATVSGLSTNTTYWYRFFASNASGSDWSDQAYGFSGKPVSTTLGDQGSGVPVTSGLVFHLDADDIDGDGTTEGLSESGLTGSTVDTWADQSASANNATKRGGTPTLVPNAVNGHAVVRTSDHATWMDFADITDIRTVFWVVSESPAATSDGFLLGDDGRYHFHRASTKGPMWSSNYANPGVKNGTTRLDGAVVNGTTTPPPLGSYGVISLITTNNVEASQITRDRTNTRSWNGDIAEILIYNRPLTAEEEQEVGAYLAWKYDLNTSYPLYAGVSLIANAAPGAITNNAAELNATLEAAGKSCDVYVSWGMTDGGTNAGSWSSNASVGSWTNVSTNINYTVTGLIPGQTYYYTFRAVSDGTNTWASPSWSFTTAGGLIPPAVPTGLSATGGNGSVSLDWDDGTADVDSYKVYRSLTSDGTYTAIQTDVSVSEYTDNDVTNFTTYYYKVSAVGTNTLESAKMDYVAATPADPSNQAPSFSGSTISETNAVEGVAYSSTLADNASDPESDPMTFTKELGPDWLNVAADGALTGMPESSDVGTNTFTVQVSAAGGSDTAQLQIIVEPAPDTTPPAAPTGLQASSGEGLVSLTWNASSEDDFASYSVYRSTESNSYTNALISGLTSTTHEDTNVVSGTTYYYVVTATDTNSNESVHSIEESITYVASSGNTLISGDFMVAGNWSAGVLPTNSLDPGFIAASVTDGTWSDTAAGLAIRQTGGTVSRSPFGWQAFSGMNYEITGGTLTAGSWGLQLVSGSVVDIVGGAVNAVGLNTDSSTVNVSSGSLTLSGNLTAKSSTFDFSGGTVSIAGYVLTTFNNATFNVSGNTTFDVTGQLGVNHFATSSTVNIGAGDGAISVGTLEAKNMTIKWASGSGFSFTATNILYESAASSWESLWDIGRMTYDGSDYTTLGSWSAVTNTDGLASGVRFNYDSETKMLTVFTDAPALEGYDQWATTWNTDIGAATNDLDSDGLNNLSEYALGGNPTNPAVSGTLPTFIKSGNGFVYIHPQRSDDTSLVYIVETTTNLISGTWTHEGYAVTGTNVTGDTLNFVTNEVDTARNEKFIRLKIQR